MSLTSPALAGVFFTTMPPRGPSQSTQATYDKLYLKTQELKNYSAFKALLVVTNIRLMSTSIRIQNIEYSF